MKEGNLKKQATNSFKGVFGFAKKWNVRRVIIYDNGREKMIKYYDGNLLRGQLNITGSTAEKCNDKLSEQIFLIKDTNGMEQIRFKTNSSDELELWINAVNTASTVQDKKSVSSNDIKVTLKDIVTNDEIRQAVSNATGIGSLSDAADLIFPGIVELSSSIPFAQPIVSLIRQFYTTYRTLKGIGGKLQVKF